MQFKLFDILSSIIPGAISLICILVLCFYDTFDIQALNNIPPIIKDIMVLITSSFIIMSYVTGYLINAIGSWIEPLLWKMWNGRPTQILFTKNQQKIGIGSESESILKWLKSMSTNKTIQDAELEKLTANDYIEIFQIAKNLVFSSDNITRKSRIEDFNNSYVFSRNILVTFIFAGFTALYLYIYVGIRIRFFFIALIATIIIWRRTKERAIYYTREILVSAYYSDASKNK
jgi:hypothetical protein